MWPHVDAKSCFLVYKHATHSTDHMSCRWLYLSKPHPSLKDEVDAQQLATEQEIFCKEGSQVAHNLKVRLGSVWYLS